MNRLQNATSPYLLQHADNPVDWWPWSDEAFAAAPASAPVNMPATRRLPGQGGWPMTVFMTPDGDPFLCGTYYPRPRFVQLVGAVADAWKKNKGQIQSESERIRLSLAE